MEMNMETIKLINAFRENRVCGRWNWTKHEYELYVVPATAMLYSSDPNVECSCAQCGRAMKYGEGFVSIEIHNNLGFGYCVCKSCYDAEWQRRRAAQHD